MGILEDGIFPHECEFEGCLKQVQFDDEPFCFIHSPDEGSSKRGYSARQKAQEVGIESSIANHPSNHVNLC